MKMLSERKSGYNPRKSAEPPTGGWWRGKRCGGQHRNWARLGSEHLEAFHKWTVKGRGPRSAAGMWGGGALTREENASVNASEGPGQREDCRP